MCDKDKARLAELRVIATSNWGHLMSEDMVIELRKLEHFAAIAFANKMGKKFKVRWGDDT